ncbi:TIGR02147 family protein [Bdellovibrio sp.]|uniref:TIGR02147 family protein n=1 Tax=Bdellovibrio sp. TaxID=28201 RepID=UPI0039E2184B
MKSHKILEQIILEKRKSNPRLSLRSIALKMEISSGRLSEILSGKRRLTEYYLSKACTALKLPPQRVEQIRRAYLSEETTKKSTRGYGKHLSEAEIEKLSTWKPGAIMSFLETTKYQECRSENLDADKQTLFIANTMGLSAQETSSLLEILNGANLIRWEDGLWCPIYNQTTTGYDVPNRYIQAGHSQDLLLAQQKLFSVDIEKRDFSSITIALNPKDIPKAKKLIRDFRRSLTSLLEKGEKRDVYQLSIQLFPISETGE